MIRLDQSVHNDPNSIELSQGAWNSYHKIHSNPLPLSLGIGHSMNHTTRLLVLALYLLAIQTSKHELHYVFLHAAQPIILLQITIHLCHLRVNGILQTVSLLHYQHSQIFHSRYTDPVLDPQNSIIIKISLLSLTLQHFVPNFA